MFDIISQDTIPMKRCERCDHEFPATNKFFRTDNRLHIYPDGLRNHCIICSKNAPKKVLLGPYPGDMVIPEGVPVQWCTRCGKPFPATKDYYSARSGEPDQLRWACKWCSYFDPTKRPPAAEKDDSEKLCGGCGNKFPATFEFFGHRHDRKNGEGLQSRCKNCQHEVRIEYYWTNKEEMHDVWRERQKEWRENNREDYNQSVQTYRNANRERINEVIRNNPNTVPRMMANNQKRRALKAGTGGSYTPQDVEDQFLRQKKKCYWCGDKIKKGKGERCVDHIVPITRGGKNDKWNIVIACRPCNSSKCDRMPHEWARGGRLL